MQWSQLKKQIEARLAPSVQGRVRFYNAAYRHSHDHEGRGWITLDGHEVLSAATLSAWKAERVAPRPQVAQFRGTVDSSIDDVWDGLAAEHRRETLAGKSGAGLYTQQEFNGHLWSYLQLALDAALASPIILHRALAFLDRRLGRRRFITRPVVLPSHSLVEACRTLRASAEGWALPDAPEANSGSPAS